MFCGNCGTPNNDTDAFCAGCGAKLIQEPVPASAPAAPVAPVAPAPKKPNKKLIIGIAAAALAVVVALVLIFTLGGDKQENSPEGVVTTFMDAFLKPDMSKMLDIIPEAVLKEDIGNKSERNEWVQEANEEVEYLMGRLDYYCDNWKITYEIKSVKDVSRDDLEDLQEWYQEEYNCKVTAAKMVTVKATFKDDSQTERLDDLQIYTIQIGGQWYIEVEESDWPSQLYYDLLY